MAPRRKYKTYAPEKVKVALRLASESISQDGKYNNSATALIMGIPESTLRSQIKRMNDTGKVENGNLNKRLLNETEEPILAYQIDKRLNMGLTITKAEVLDLATKIYRKKVTLGKVGKKWFECFMSRHPELYNRWTKCVRLSRKQGSSYERVKSWFDLFDKVVVKGKISDDNVYNMGEIRFQFGNTRDKWTMERVCENDKEETSSEYTDSAIVLETVSMSGRYLEPYVIFKELNGQNQWCDKNNIPKSSCYNMSIDWLEKVFIPQTRAREVNEKVVLVLAAHGSHTDDKFIQLCSENNILPIFMPPNTSNFLQPLYRSCFTNLEMDYSCVIDEQVSTTNYNKENRTDFVTSYGISREKAFEQGSIGHSWKVAGLKQQNYEEVLNGPYVKGRPQKVNPKVKNAPKKVASNLYESAADKAAKEYLTEFMSKSKENSEIGVEYMFDLLLEYEEETRRLTKLLLQRQRELIRQKDKESIRALAALNSSLDDGTVDSLAYTGIQGTVEEIREQISKMEEEAMKQKESKDSQLSDPSNE